MTFQFLNEIREESRLVSRKTSRLSDRPGGEHRILAQPDSPVAAGISFPFRWHRVGNGQSCPGGERTERSLFSASRSEIAVKRVAECAPGYEPRRRNPATAKEKRWCSWLEGSRKWQLPPLPLCTNREDGRGGSKPFNTIWLSSIHDSPVFRVPAFFYWDFCRVTAGQPPHDNRPTSEVR